MTLFRSLLLLVCLYWGSMASGCRCSEPRPLPVEVWYDGCASVWRGPTCLLGTQRELVLWVRTAPAAVIELEFGGGAEVRELAAVDGGRRYKVRVPEGTAQGRVIARTTDARGSWQIGLREEPGEPEWLLEARRLRKVPLTEEAIALLEPHLADPDPTWRARALGLRARLAMDQGQTGRTCELLEQAGRLNVELGHDFDAINDLTTLAYQHTEFTRRFDEARRVLSLAPRPPDGYITAEIFLAVQWSLLETTTGDLRSALARLRSAIRIASRAEQMEYRLGLALSLASANGRIGLLPEDAQQLDTLRLEMPANTSPCLRRLMLNNEAGLLLISADAGEQNTIDPIPLLEEARDLLDGPCPLPQKRASTLSNLALAYLQAGQYDQAKAQLAALAKQTSRLPAVEEAWRLDVEGRLAMAEGRAAEALELFQQQERLAEVAVLPAEQWRALVGQARALAAQSQSAAALAQYDRAEALSQRSLLRVPLDASRAAFVAQHRQAVREHVQLLVTGGRAAEAMQICRGERVRAWDALRLGAASSSLSAEDKARVDSDLEAYWLLRQKLDDEAAEDWHVPEDQLEQVRQRRRGQDGSLGELLDRAFGLTHSSATVRFSEPAAGELVLLFFSLADSWMGFAEDHSGVDARTLGPLEAARLTPAELSERLLSPFSAKLDRAERVKVLAMGPLEEVDVHSLPWNGAPLDVGKTVVYGLDAPTEDASSPLGERPLIVAVVDPAYDLPGARAEAATLRSTLGRGSDILRLYDRADVSAAALASELGQARLFHFSGHGKFQGSAGWESALVLSEGSQLLVTDILALRAAPQTVVLLGCETARSGGRWTVGLGLANAFLLAGSRLVVASSQPIADDVAAQLSAELYRNLDGRALEVETVRAAVLRLREAYPQSDGESLRILVR